MDRYGYCTRKSLRSSWLTFLISELGRKDICSDQGENWQGVRFEESSEEWEGID